MVIVMAVGAGVGLGAVGAGLVLDAPDPPLPPPQAHAETAMVTRIATFEYMACMPEVESKTNTSRKTRKRQG
jgi:hypothetical protein